MIPLLIIKKQAITQLIYSDHIEELRDKTILQWFNQQCLNHGTTLKGTMDALRFHLKIRQKIPICLNIMQRIMYFPISVSELDIWILYDQNAHIRRVDIYSILTIHSMSFKFPVDARVIKRQLGRCKTYLDAFYRPRVISSPNHIYESLVSDYLVKSSAKL